MLSAFPWERKSCSARTLCVSLGKLNNMQNPFAHRCHPIRCALSLRSSICCHVGKLPRQPPRRRAAEEDASTHLNTHPADLPLAKKRFARLDSVFICIIFTMCGDPRSNPCLASPCTLEATRASRPVPDTTAKGERRRCSADNATRPNINFLHSHANQIPLPRNK